MVTLEELLEWPADQFDSLNDKQLEELCKPFWNITRPEMAMTESVKKKTENIKIITKEEREKMDKIAFVKNFMAQKGIKI